MSRWEYAELSFQPARSRFLRVLHIAAMGAVGWELVGFDAIHSWIFKRQLTDV